MSFRHSHIVLTVAALLVAGGCNSAGTGGTFPPGVPSQFGAVRTAAGHGISSQYTFTDYAIPTANSYPNRIIVGPDGALWFTEEGYAASKIGRVTTHGAFSEFQLNGGTEPSHLVSAYGNVWFTSQDANTIGFVTPSSGQVTYDATSSTTRGIVEGAGFNRVWFTEFQAGDVAIVDATTGAITEYTVPTQSSEPYDLAYGKTKSVLWFTEFGAKKIGSVTGTGTFKEYKTPSDPESLVFGPDGALWFTEPNANRIGRMTTSGSVTEYPTPTKGSDPEVITVGPDGALWFTEFIASQIGRITTAGKITETATPDAKAQPTGITTGPDHNIWFVEHATNAIVKLTL